MTSLLNPTSVATAVISYTQVFSFLLRFRRWAISGSGPPAPFSTSLKIEILLFCGQTHLRSILFPYQSQYRVVWVLPPPDLLLLPSAPTFVPARFHPSPLPTGEHGVRSCPPHLQEQRCHFRQSFLGPAHFHPYIYRSLSTNRRLCAISVLRLAVSMSSKFAYPLVIWST